VKGMKQNRFFIILVLVALISGCVKTPDIQGTYTHDFKEFTKNRSEEITFYNDGTWFYQKIGQSSTNSGVFTKHDDEILTTASIGSENFKIQKDGSLIDSKNQTWIKKS